MKAFYRKAISLCFFLVVLFMIVGPAAAETDTPSGVSVVEIRGPVYSGSDIDDIVVNTGTTGTIIMDANNFAAFFYDIKP